ncbi:hypothetical protein KW805_00100 [Candidatus Pacearchaeota archaeon]|nr:hypothetical protein [Candidatus Pacearchaeota archaeon]
MAEEIRLSHPQETILYLSTSEHFGITLSEKTRDSYDVALQLQKMGLVNVHEKEKGTRMYDVKATVKGREIYTEIENRKKGGLESLT